MHVNGIAKAAAKLGYTGVIPTLSPEAQKAFADPYAQRWHPGSVMFDFSNALVALHGPDALETHSYEMTKSSFGAALRPLISVALALMGGNPSALFARVGDGLSLALRGVRVKWRGEDRTLTIQYPSPLPDAAVASWRGVLRFLFELAKHPEGRLEAHTFSADRRTLTLVLGWPPAT